MAVKRKKQNRASLAINERLVVHQGLDDATVRQIERLHCVREEIKDVMDAIEPDTKMARFHLRRLMNEWHVNEYALQILWGFKPDSNWHAHFSVPHCECPYLDNWDRIGMSEKPAPSPRCPYHGTKD